MNRIKLSQDGYRLTQQESLIVGTTCGWCGSTIPQTRETEVWTKPGRRPIRLTYISLVDNCPFCGGW